VHDAGRQVSRLGAQAGVTRREALSGAAVLGIGAGLDRVLLGGHGSASSLRPNAVDHATESFHGARQAGIATPAQEYLCFAAFDVTSNSLGDVEQMLRQWTSASASMTAGIPYRAEGAEQPGQPPLETGEAAGLGACRLTLTFGFGPSLFGSGDADRFGLAHRRPAELIALPPFQGESLQPERSGGDLCVQACAESPQVAFHAIHVLSRIADGVAVLRWAQPGFGRTSSTSTSQETPRNLMGFKDGTDNIRAEDKGSMDQYVWVQPGDGPSWMTGGTYLIARRIKILFDVWDATSLEGQERVIGRDKLVGAPLGGRGEYDHVNLKAMTDGQLTIPENAHIRLANPASNDGQRILRRGYSYSEGVEPGAGELDAGLFFIAFQRSPPRQFIPLQRRLAASDALNRHTLHTASAIFACPPGLKPGAILGDGLISG
jgi:deferrochelatase/peroxidase EfeB